MKKITAKFSSRCAETGARIVKGEVMVYDYASRKCYCSQSNTFKGFEEEPKHSEFIQDPGEQYFDNWAMNNL